MRIWKSLSAALILCGSACAPAPPESTIFEQELRQADVEFDRAVADGDIAAFADLVADDAVFFGAATPLEGRDAVVAAWRPFLDPDSGFTLRWSPTDVEVGSSGDLGVTRGNYRSTRITEDGSISVGVGFYVTVWRRSEDAKWRAILDIGTSPQPAQSSQP
jgi:ketosteroid isomerase-like protein